MISIEPRGADLGAVTAATRSAAEIAAIGGYITQVWTWRGGEAVVLQEWSPRGYGDRWVVIVRRGLRRGVPQRLYAGSIAAALTALGIAYRMKSVRRRPIPPEPWSIARRRRRLLPGVHRRGNTRRTLRPRRPDRSEPQVSHGGVCAGTVAGPGRRPRALGGSTSRRSRSAGAVAGPACNDLRKPGGSSTRVQVVGGELTVAASMTASSRGGRRHRPRRSSSSAWTTSSTGAGWGKRAPPTDRSVGVR